ncbi:MAG: pitrilysin family protein [Oligoflexia bacterium]|nr:pitrilysin family protein [Oligoflexia bacterium]
MPRHLKFHKTVFPNGLTLVTERMPGFRSISMGAWVKTGTRHESTKEAGVSHFLEHMLFKGTHRRTALEIAREIDRVGGDFNAFTAREHTCFHLFMLDRDVALGADILSDVLLNSTFDSKELDRERKVILQEIVMVDEAPEELAHDLYYEKIFPDHGLGRPILGTVKSIRGMKRREIVGYFHARYQPEDLIISVAGDVSHEALVKKLKPLMRSRWPGRKSCARTSSRHEVPRFQPGKWWAARELEQVHLVWGVRGPKATASDRYAAYLLNVYLGDGMSSSLFQEIREKNALAYTVYSSLSAFEDTGVFSVYAATSPHKVSLCLQLIEKCVNELRTRLLKKSEMKSIKDSVKGSILLSTDSVESRMFSIARNELVYGRQITPEEVCREIDAVTPEQIRALAEKILGHEGNRAILAMGPKPGRARLASMGFTNCPL